MQKTVREGDKLLYKSMLTKDEMILKSERNKIVKKIGALCGRLEFETYLTPTITPAVITPTVIGDTITPAVVGDALLPAGDTITPALLPAGDTITPALLPGSLKRKRDDDEADTLLQRAIYYGRKSDAYFDLIFNETSSGYSNIYSVYKGAINNISPRILVVGDRDLYLKMITDGNDYVLYRETTVNLPPHDFIIVKEGITIEDELEEEEYIE
jgi:hypothetical protein